MTNEIKCKLKEKTKIYRNFVKNKYYSGYKQLLMEKMTETSNIILSANEKYYKNEGVKLLDLSLWAQKNTGLF